MLSHARSDAVAVTSPMRSACLIARRQAASAPRTFPLSHSTNPAGARPSLPRFVPAAAKTSTALRASRSASSAHRSSSSESSLRANRRCASKRHPVPDGGNASSIRRSATSSSPASSRASARLGSISMRSGSPIERSATARRRRFLVAPYPPWSGPGGPLIPGLSGARPENADAVTDHAKLVEIVMRRLQVIAEDLLLLLDPVSCHTFEPSCEAFVLLRPELLRHRPVRRVADQQMTEAECVIAWDRRTDGPHKLLSHQRQQVRRDLGPKIRGCELSNSAQEEFMTRHRS